MDKGGTQTSQSKAVFDPKNPETRPESVREADKKISLVMERIINPVASKS